MKTKTVRNLLLSIILSVVFLFIIFGFSDLQVTFEAIKNVSFFWFFVAVLSAFAVWLFEALTLKIFSTNFSKKIDYLYLLKITLIGSFFSAITPLSTGGQPAQIAFMSKNDVEGGKATAIVVSRFIAYQIALTFFGLMGIFFAYPFVSRNVSNWAFLFFIGFAVNSGVLILALLFSLKRKMAEFIVKIIIKPLSWIKIIKNPKKLEQKVLKEAHFFNIHMKKMLSNPLSLILGFMSSSLRLFSFISVPYFVILSLGLNYGFFEIIATQLVLFLIFSMAPTPGASGASEVGYMVFFSNYFGNKITAGLLIWRFLTYYVNLIIGGILTSIETKRSI
ncbi:MAG: lysylphosphatidylglycerol synthase transmembrane domain-containing protein [Kosmotogaceae bacterium]